MGYSIIFDTIFVRLSDGRLIHFDRSGCNNDRSGRSRSEFTGSIYVNDGSKRTANYYLGDEFKSRKDDFEMKIGSRPCSLYKYGEHLLRMEKRAVSYADFIKQRHVTASRYDGIQVYSPDRLILPPKEADDYFYKHLYNSEFTYRRIVSLLDVENEIEIAASLEKEEPVEFFISTKGKTAYNVFTSSKCS